MDEDKVVDLVDHLGRARESLYWLQEVADTFAEAVLWLWDRILTDDPPPKVVQDALKIASSYKDDE